MRLPRGSSSPRRWPATENAWQGVPATRRSMGAAPVRRSQRPRIDVKSPRLGTSGKRYARTERANGSISANQAGRQFNGAPGDRGGLDSRTDGAVDHKFASGSSISWRSSGGCGGRLCNRRTRESIRRRPVCVRISSSQILYGWCLRRPNGYAARSAARTSASGLPFVSDRTLAMIGAATLRQ